MREILKQRIEDWLSANINGQEYLIPFLTSLVDHSINPLVSLQSEIYNQVSPAQKEMMVNQFLDITKKSFVHSVDSQIIALEGNLETLVLGFGEEYRQVHERNLDDLRSIKEVLLEDFPDEPPF